MAQLPIEVVVIFRRYGTAFQSVDLNFDSKALNEVGFRRNHEQSIAAEDFESAYTRVRTEALTSEAEGDVQDHTEQVLLDRLEEQVNALAVALGPGEILVVENESGHDYPKTKQRTANVIVQGENKLHFTYSIAPPLRIAIHKRSD